MWPAQWRTHRWLRDCGRHVQLRATSSTNIAPEFHEVRKLASQRPHRCLCLLLFSLTLDELLPQLVGLPAAVGAAGMPDYFVATCKCLRGCCLSGLNAGIDSREGLPDAGVLHLQALVFCPQLLQLPMEVVQGSEVKAPGRDAADNGVLGCKPCIRRQALQAVDLDGAASSLERRI